MTLLSLIAANTTMMVRNRQAIFWALAFPLVFVVVFGLFFTGNDRNVIAIHVIDHSKEPLSQSLVRDLGNMDRIDLQVRDEEASARKDLEAGNIRYLLIIPDTLGESIENDPPVTVVLMYAEETVTTALMIARLQRFLDKTNLELNQAPALLTLEATGTLAKQLDYFDFLLPGFVALGIMTYSIIGLASEVAVYRERRILRRIFVTPLKVRTFFLAKILVYLALSLVQATVILAVGVVLFDGQFLGNYVHIGVLILLGNLVFLCLGFIVGTFAQNVQAASGMGNAVTMPMMFLSGVFFPREDLPPIIVTFVDYLPLSPMLDALRGVALDAKPLWDFPVELALLVGWLTIGSAIAVRVFKFN